MIALDPPGLHFGDELVRGQSFSAKTVRVFCDKSVADLSLSYNSSSLSVNLQRPIEKEKTFQLIVGPKNTLPVGPFKFDVVIFPVNSKKQTAHKKGFHVEGRVLDDVQTIPVAMRLGPREKESYGQAQVVLRSVGKKPFIVKAFGTTSSSLEVSPFSSQPTDGVAFAIRQTISNLGHQETHVTFSVESDGAKERRTIVLPVFYYGLPPVTRNGQS
jgi:hypothetical protein